MRSNFYCYIAREYNEIERDRKAGVLLPARRWIFRIINQREKSLNTICRARLPSKAKSTQRVEKVRALYARWMYLKMSITYMGDSASITQAHGGLRSFSMKNSIPRKIASKNENWTFSRLYRVVNDFPFKKSFPKLWSFGLVFPKFQSFRNSGHFDPESRHVDAARQ